MDDKLKDYVPGFRSILKWEWYTDINVCHLYRHFLLIVKVFDTSWQGTIIKRGQIVTSLRVLEGTTGLSIQNLRTSMSKLIKSGYLTQIPYGKNTIYTVTYYDKHTSTNTDYNTDTNTNTNTDTNTNTNTDTNTASTQILTQHQHIDPTIHLINQDVPAPNKENKDNKEKREGKKEEALSPDFENLDLKKERVKWYSYMKAKHNMMTDKHINISYGVFLSTYPAEKWIWPVWQKWVEIEKPEMYKQSNSNENIKPYQHDETYESTLDTTLQKVRNELRKKYGDAIFSNWIRHLDLQKYEGSTCYLSTSTDFITKWIQKNYSDYITKILQEIKPEIKIIKITTHAKKEKVHAN